MTASCGYKKQMHKRAHCIQVAAIIHYKSIYYARFIFKKNSFLERKANVLYTRKMAKL